jgi:hypothetical protein
MAFLQFYRSPRVRRHPKKTDNFGDLGLADTEPAVQGYQITATNLRDQVTG